MKEQWIIECRSVDGSLDFTGLQPENVFGLQAITGISEDDMAKTVFAQRPDATLDGRNIPRWPSFIDPRWAARRKTW